MDPSTMKDLLKTFQSQLDVQQQLLNQMSLLVQQLSNHHGFPASSSGVQAVNEFHPQHPADPSSISMYSSLNPHPSNSQLGNAAAPPGGCSNPTSFGYMRGDKAIYHQPALLPRFISQPAPAPLGGCCRESSSYNILGAYPYQRPDLLSQSVRASSPLTATPATIAVPPGASLSGLADVESPVAVPSCYKTTPGPRLAPKDGYSYNCLRPETICDDVFITPYSMANKDQEFPLWINQFEEAVNLSFNPHSQLRHFAYCLQWLPGSLEADAYSIWKECQYARSDWVKLKEELKGKFEDPAERKDWFSNPHALKWDEENESLHIFASKVRRKVNTFDSQYADSEAARAPLYFTRFMNGMPKDYFRYLTLRLPSRCQSLEKALEISVQFQAYKRNLAHQ